MARLTQAQIDATIEALNTCYNDDGSVGYAKIAVQLGIDASTAYRRVKRIKQMASHGLLGTRAVLPGYQIKSVASKDEDGTWIKQTKEPGEKFETPAGHAIKGVSALVDSDGRVIQQWVKTGAERTDLIIDAIKEALETYTGRAELRPPPERTVDGLLTVYPIADQHNGLMAWGRETGEAYDLRIGADRLRSTMSQLVSRSPASEEAIILNLGDWTHQDSNKNMTPASGHILDVDGRYQKVVTTGFHLMTDCIDLALQKHNKVTVRNIPGNHDPHASVALTLALLALYSKEPRVTIDDDPSDFFFHLHGNTLIGANHGHRMKPADMAMNMAVRKPVEWGKSLYRWCLFGHIHHETLKEVGGVRCESFQTLAAKDSYSHSHGYNSGQSLNSITLDKEAGEIERCRVNIKPSYAR
jgi:hypothetical protein